MLILLKSGRWVRGGSGPLWVALVLCSLLLASCVLLCSCVCVVGVQSSLSFLLHSCVHMVAWCGLLCFEVCLDLATFVGVCTHTLWLSGPGTYVWGCVQLWVCSVCLGGGGGDWVGLGCVCGCFAQAWL